MASSTVDSRTFRNANGGPARTRASAGLRWSKTRGAWRWPLGKGAAGRRKPRGKWPWAQSETLFRVCGHSAHYTMVEIEIKTGRKHQIRRHARLAGHPVVGDEKYGDRAVNRDFRRLGLKRMFLHAQSLSFERPGGGETLCISAPLQSQLREFLDRLEDGEPGGLR
mgnify:CR=1 FL=1